MTNTNKAVGFVLVNSKEIKSTVTNERTAFPVQVRMELQVGAKSQVVSFGHSAIGGRQTYLSARGKAPVSMTRAEFIKKLREANIENINQVSKALSAIRYFNRDEFVVAKCECCGTGYVTAANVDFIQRNHKALSEKLGRKVNEFSRICYTCQGHDGKKPVKKSAAKDSTSVTIPAQAHSATCASCGKEVKSQKVAEFSLKTYGKVLCYKPCQGKHPKLNKDTKQQAPTQQPVKKEEPANKEVPVQQTPVDKYEGEEGVVITPALLREIMELNVDPYSEIAQFQHEYQAQHLKNCKEEHTLWANLFNAQEPRALQQLTDQAKQEVEVEYNAYADLMKDRARELGVTGIMTDYDPAEGMYDDQEGPDFCTSCGGTTTDHSEDCPEASAASVNNGTSEASIPFADELCVICDKEMPPVDQWKYDVCPTCCLPTGHTSLDLPVDMVEAAHKYIEGASEASATLSKSETGVLAGEDSSEPSSQEEAKGNHAVSEKDTKEVPMSEALIETDTKSQNPAGPSNGSHESGEITDFLSVIVNEK